MTDLNNIINEQRKRIAELEQSQIPNGYIAVPADAWHELCQQEKRAEAAEKRLAEVERNLGFAVKATYGIIDGKEVAIQKDPKTDSGIN